MMNYLCKDFKGIKRYAYTGNVMPNPYFQLRQGVRRLVTKWSRRESHRRHGRLSGRATARTCHWHVLSVLCTSALPFDSRLFLYRNTGHAWHVLYFYGVGGSRTRVQKSIPRPSTIIVHLLRFPPSDNDERFSEFGSFMIRTHAQSFAYAVSCLFDASAPADRYSGLTAAALRQLLTRNYRLRLFCL